ncbi:MAG: hypothetical protein WBP56_10070 [Polyangia bacterium]
MSGAGRGAAPAGNRDAHGGTGPSSPGMMLGSRSGVQDVRRAVDDSGLAGGLAGQGLRSKVALMPPMVAALMDLMGD